MNHTDIVHTYYNRATTKLPIGRLAMKDRRIFFEYASEFLQTKLELSPFKLPLKAGVFECFDRCFDGLFGLFNDSLPDGWGRLLLDRKLMKLGIHPGALTPLDRLCYVGSHGMGALSYDTEIEAVLALQHDNLDEIANECIQFQEHESDRFIDDLLAMNGSSTGVRPKVLVTLVDDSFKTTNNANTTSNHDWIIKFSSPTDPKDAGLIEYAYHLMAVASGIDVPEAKLFKSTQHPGFFGVKRFDRTKDGPVHMHTASGLLHADHRTPSLDYESLIKATLHLTKDERECAKQFRNAVFNVLTHNRDDHAKNFSFLMNTDGAWHVSPAYDLTFSFGPGGEHSTTIMGEGKNPDLNHLLRLAMIGGIKQQKAVSIIDEVKGVVSRWPDFAKNTGVTPRSLTMVSDKINAILTRF